MDVTPGFVSVLNLSADRNSIFILFRFYLKLRKTWQYLPDGWRYQRWGEATKPSN